MSYKNPEDKKARMQKYRAENKDRIRETARKWRQRKRTEVTQYNRKAYLVRQYKGKPRLKHLYEVVLAGQDYTLFLDGLLVYDLSTDWTMEKGAKPQLHFILDDGGDCDIAYLDTPIEISPLGEVTFDLWDRENAVLTLHKDGQQLTKKAIDELVKGEDA